jgi:hypothetical protein
METYDLEFLINLLYEYNYVKKTDKCFDVNDITLDDIKDIDNIKIIPPPNKINAYINQIFNIDINYIKKYGQDYVFSRVGPLNTTISIRPYISDESRNDVNSEDNKNKQISFILSDLVTKKLTRHILLPILNIDIPLKNLIPFLQKYPDLELNKSNSKYLSISISERFFKMMTLDEYLTETNLKIMKPTDFLNIIFQVIHALAVIRNKYPKFNHNLLNTESISVYVTDKNDHEFIYKYDDKNIKINSCGVIIKIGNFNLAEINSTNNDDVKTFMNSLLANNNVKEYLKKNSTIENFIIEYINMKPEQIMKNQKFINQIGAGKSKKIVQDLIDDDTKIDFIGGRRKLFMSNREINNKNTTSISEDDKTVKPEQKQNTKTEQNQNTKTNTTGINKIASAFGINNNEISNLNQTSPQNLPLVTPDMESNINSSNTGSMPMQGMPMQGMPTQGMPMQGMPMQGMPGMMPMQGMPMQGMPMQGMPMQGMPMQGMPMQGMPGMMPMQGMPMQGMPMQGMPMQGMQPDMMQGMQPDMMQGMNQMSNVPPMSMISSFNGTQTQEGGKKKSKKTKKSTDNFFF